MHAVVVTVTISDHEVAESHCAKTWCRACLRPQGS
jgi:hypothetical protein